MLEYAREFMVLVGCLNYTAASHQLNISQPTLSRHMADLEKELGFSLLERNPLSLTPAGKYYVEAISDIIARLDTVTDQGRMIAHGESKVLSICMTPSQDGAYSNIIYASIARMCNEVLGFIPRFYSSRKLTIFEAVQSGKADVGVIYNVPENLPEDIGCEWLLDHPFIAWVHKKNPIVKSHTIKFEDLADCKLICSTNQLFRAYFDGSVDIFREHGIEPKHHMKDIDDTSNFLVDLGQDEVVFGSDMGDTTCSFNPFIIGLRFPELKSPTYLLYRKKPEKYVITKFVKTCHAVARDSFSSDR